MPTLPVAAAGATTLVLAKEHKFTLDQAKFNFTVTLKAANGTFDST